MKITHRAPVAPALAAAQSLADKAPHLSCCCRLSELLPLVRQVHDAARAARLAAEAQPGLAA